MSLPRRWMAAGGIAGPASFVAAWSILGATRSGYSPVHDPISRLAAVGSSTRPAMTAGFLAFSVGVGLYGAALRQGLPDRAGRAAAAAAVGTAVATLGVAALPLEGFGGDQPHAVAAGAAYTTLAALPVLGGLAFAAQGRRGVAAASMATGAAVGAALLTSVLTPSGTGLAQRVGLTLGDAWIVATSVWMLRGAAGDRRSRR